MLYRTQGTCSRAIKIVLNQDHIIEEVAFDGGCNGNTQGIASLVRGQKAEDVIKRLRGIRCGAKLTSCPDQLARALEQAVEQKYSYL